MQQTSEDLIVLIIATSIALLVFAIMTIWLFVYFHRRKVKFIKDMQAQQALFQDELLKAKMEISEQTLQNIGWELHDNIGQLLSVAQLKLKMLLRDQSKEEDHSISEVTEIVGNSLREVRSLSKSLSKEYFQKQGLVRSLHIELDRYDKLRFLKTTFKILGEERPLKPENELIIFRILQEFFANAIKHSKAEKLGLILDYSDQFLLVQAHDNGIGFDTLTEHTGSGLINMKSRAKLLDANIDIHSKPGEGTDLILKYPYQRHDKNEV